MNLRLAFVLIAMAPMALAQPIVHTGSSFPAFDNLMTQTMQRYGIPGGALSISYQGKLVHAAGYGYGDVEGGVAVQPNSMLRVHSISKAFLMWALFGAVDEGKFQLSDKAFALLGPSFTPPPGVPPCAPAPVAPCVDPRLADITVQQLFDHQGGWDPDPIETYLQPAAAAFGVPSPPSADILIRYVMGQPLNYTPGSRSAYAGIDYVIVARIIEAKAANPGETFAEYFRRKFMLPLRASRTNLASSTLSGLAPWEVKQYVDTNEIGTGIKAPSKWDAFPGLRPVQYEGGAAMAAADAAGGFGSTMPELTRLITAMLGDLGPALNPLPNYSPYVAHGASTAWTGGWWGSVSEWISFPGANGQVTAAFSFNTADTGRPIPNDASSWNPLGEVDAGIRAFAASNASWPQVDLFPQYLGPVLTSLSTSVTPVSAQPFTLTVTGAHFDPATSVVRVMAGPGTTCYDPGAPVQLGCRVPVNLPQSTSTSVQVLIPGYLAGAYSVTVFNGDGPDSNALTLLVPGPSVSISDVTLAEGNGGTTNAVFNVTLSASSLQTITVSAATSDLSATAGSDYTASGPTTITFAPGITVQTFSVPIVGDTAAESTETFQVTLSAPVNVTILDGIGIGTITNDDGTAPSRVFVSSSGSDVNVCSTQTTPCRNLAAAIAQVAVDGEVIVLTPGEYEAAPLLIAKGMKITSPSGTVAFVRQPITINAAGGRVVLRGLTLKGTGAGNAVTLVLADALSVEDSTLDGWSVGLRLTNAAPSQVVVSNSMFRASAFGISDLGGASSNRVSVGESRFEGNGTGIDVRSGSFLVRESTFAGNSANGVLIGPGSLDIQRSEFLFNGVGVNASSSGSVRIGQSRVFGNTTGLAAGAGSSFVSSGRNVVRRNGTDTTGTITVVPEQ